MNFKFKILVRTMLDNNMRAVDVCVEDVENHGEWMVRTKVADRK
jgi:hypothetical protein